MHNSSESTLSHNANLQCVSICRDECVNFPIQKGLDASRSKIKFFRHNDCDHLEQLLTQQAVEDKKVLMPLFSTKLLFCIDQTPDSRIT